jgi:hypothetical protein
LPSFLFTAFLIWDAFLRLPSMPVCCLPIARLPAARRLCLLAESYTASLLDYTTDAMFGAGSQQTQVGVPHSSSLPASFFSAFLIWDAFPRFLSAPICPLRIARLAAAHCLCPVARS